MGWAVLYLVLAASFCASFLFPGSGHFSLAEGIKLICGAGGAIGAFVQALAKVHLRTYLFLQRARIWWHSDRTSIWKFGLRLDGISDPDPLALIRISIGGALARWEPRVLGFTGRTMLLQIDKTIHLQMSFVPEDESEDGEAHLLVESHDLEMSYGNAEKKLDGSIVPILGALKTIVHPVQSSSMFEATFSGTNPFFGFYVEHLKAEQIKHFNIVFTPYVSHDTRADRVTVTAKGIEISSGSNEAFCRLTKAFLLLSSESIAITKV